MNPIDLIKSGIIDSDWNKVKQAYRALTGAEVETVSKPSDNFIAPINKQTVKLDEDGNKMLRAAKRLPLDVNKIREVGNMFVDDLTLERQDIEIDRKIKHIKIQKRQQVSQKKYKCVQCNRSFLLFSTQVISDEYVCDECISKKGR